ncbi:MAG: hypothetical protein AAFW83_10415 [Pseudomonadota bacterium]
MVLLIRGLTIVGGTILGFLGIGAISQTEQLLRAAVPVMLIGGTLYLISR